MAKYEQDVQALLRLIGGKENIRAVSHCMTRMRFVLADEKKADTDGIGKLPSVKGTFTQAGQYQVIIGNDVSVFYNEFTKYAGIEGVSKDAVKAAAQTNQSLLQRIMGTLGEIFAPIIPALICGGLILGFRNIIGEINFLGGGTQSLADVSKFWAGMYSFLWLIGEAVFHMLPVGICWSVTKKMGTTQILGIVLGLTLVSGQLLNAYSVATTAAADIPYWDFGFFKVNMIGYQAQVIPAMLAAFTLVYLEKFFRKICPAVISMIVVPFCSLVLSVMAAHFVLGPIGWAIGSAVSSAVYAGISGPFRVIFGAIFGFVYAPLVITGLHHTYTMIETSLLANTGFNPVITLCAMYGFANVGTCLAFFVKSKKESVRQTSIGAMLSQLFGISEPVLFGIQLRYNLRPLIIMLFTSGLGAAVLSLLHVQSNSYGLAVLPSYLMYIYEPYQLLCYFLVSVGSVALCFVLTCLFGIPKEVMEKDEE